MTGSLSGYLSGVSLFGVLQLLHLERKTCVLSVSADAREGELMLVAGDLVDARVGDAEGEAAVHQILAWKDPRVTIRAAAPLNGKGISTPLTQILIDSVRLQDEGTMRPPAVDIAFAIDAAMDLADANERGWLGEAMAIAGAMAVALVEVATGDVVAAAEGGGTLDLATAASGIAAVVRAKLAVTTALRVEDAVEDIVITLTGQYHLIRVLQAAPWRFLYLVLDRHEANLAMARRTLARIEAGLA